MKKWDKIIIVLLIAISFLPWLGHKIVKGEKSQVLYATVTVDGKLVKKIPLTGQEDAVEYVICTEAGSNTLCIEHENIRVSQSDCPDHICEDFGSITKPGEIIVCLPHQLYVEIVGSTESEQDIRTY